MVNEDKIGIMTSLVMYEKKEGRKLFPFQRYFKSDFIGIHLLTAFVGYTLCSFLLVALWVLYHLDMLLNAMNIEDLAATGKQMIICYFAGLAIYLLVTGIVYKRKYDYAKGGMRVYLAKLRRLEKLYLSKEDLNL